MNKTTWLLLIALLINYSHSCLAQSCSTISYVEQKALSKITTTFKINASQIGGQYSEYNIHTADEAKVGLYTQAYALAAKNTLGVIAGGLFIAAGSPAVVEVTYTDGSKDSFVHAPGVTASDNWTIPGREYDSSGNAVCPNNNNASTGGGGGSGSGGNGGGVDPPGGCYGDGCWDQSCTRGLHESCNLGFNYPFDSRREFILRQSDISVNIA